MAWIDDKEILRGFAEIGDTFRTDSIGNGQVEAIAIDLLTQQVHCRAVGTSPDDALRKCLELAKKTLKPMSDSAKKIFETVHGEKDSEIQKLKAQLAALQNGQGNKPKAATTTN